MKPEYSLNDIEQTIAYNIKNHINDPKAKDDFLKLLTNTEQIISKLKNNETQGDKND